MRVNHSATETMEPTDWNAIDWRRANRVVRNLRQRIFKAERSGDHAKVRSLQKLMLRSKSNTLLSVRQVTQVNNGGRTAGVDRVVIKTPEARARLVDEVQSFQPWRTSPVRRVYIPKTNGKLRPLGIPTIRDRVMQARVKNALEPQWEARFEASSYGFRPGRSAHDAISAVFHLASPQGRKRWIVDADIEGAFDNISHEFLMQTIGSTPGHGLIRQWLKAGYVEMGIEHSTIAGTPQGGVISPLLANIALHGMEKALGVKRQRCDDRIVGHRAVVRYADDFVVFCESQDDAHRVMGELEGWLTERGLRLSKAKTRVVHLQEGFDFLGFNVREYDVPNSKRGVKTWTKPSKASVMKLRDRLRQEWLALRSAPVGVMVARLNPIIRGWTNYFRMGVSSEVFNKLDHWMFHREVRYARSRHPKKSWAWLQAKYWGQLNKWRDDRWVFGDKQRGGYVLRFAWTKIQRHTMVKGQASPDDARFNQYFEERRRKAHSLNSERLKMARAQGWRCPMCGTSLLNGEVLHDHHLVLDRNDEGRERLELRRLVHYYCHQQIHSEGGRDSATVKGLLRLA